MKVKHKYIVGSLALIVIMMPNLTWWFIIPTIVVFLFYALFLVKITAARASVLIVLFTFLAITAAVLPETTKYNLFFILICAFSLWFLDLVQDPDVLKFVLSFGAWVLVASILVSYFLPVGEFLQSRPEFDSYLYGIFRQRGMYSEPANLGYWSALLAFLSYTNQYYRAFIIYIVTLVLSASAGALVFFSLLIFMQLRHFRFKDRIVLIAMGTVIFYLLGDQIRAKFSISDSISFANRLNNLELTLEYIWLRFPMPSGFGPIYDNSLEVGVTSFILLVVKAFGIFTMFFLPILWRFRSFPLALIPIVFLSSAIGNFWEAPILILLFGLAFNNWYKSKSFSVRKSCQI